MIALFLLFSIITVLVSALDRGDTIMLNQGNLVGLKVFPESSRTPVLAFLGIPYAKAPISELRFAPPEPHPGWNRTLYARNFKPLCPQLETNIYEEIANGFNLESKITSEDCLFLNVWTPETALRYGGFPVVVMITGEEMSFDWLINRPTGLDLASEGIIFVTIQYRSNIFGWFGLEDEFAPGNLALLDQNLALHWVKDNVAAFGGDAKKVTLLGHGTTGASAAMIHLTSPRGKFLFSNLVLMSGSVFSRFDFRFDESNPKSNPSKEVVKTLACEANEKRRVLRCMRDKSVSDLLRAFDNVYKNGNYTQIFGPVIDDYISVKHRYIRDDPRNILKNENFNDVPILIGLCSNEGAFTHEHWIDLAKQGYRTLKKHIDQTILPQILNFFKLRGMGEKQILEAINWKFFEQIPRTPAHLLNSLQKLISETRFEVPFLETIEILSHSWREDRLPNNSAENTTYFPLTNFDEQHVKEKNNLFVYVFQQSTAMDMRGKINYFGGASHSSDLPFLLGPSLFQQIGRKKMTVQEEKLCRKMRSLFAEFIKTGNPTPNPTLFDAWHPYSLTQKYVKVLSSKPETKLATKETLDTSDEMNLVQIEQMLTTNSDEVQVVSSDLSNPYNPYNLNAPRDIYAARQPKTTVTGFFQEVKNSEYFYHLKKVYAFWGDFLPKLYRMLENERQIWQEDEDEAALLENGSPKYKHAFFSMLTLVCLLLAILGVCVYILKKENPNFSSTML